MTTTINDLARSAEAVGSGELVSPELHQEQVGTTLAGIGEQTEQCPVCRPLTETRSYGLGVVLLNGWITQTKSFAGSGASIGYLPSEQLAIATITTLTPDAFDEQGAGNPASGQVMTEIAAALTDTLPVGN